MAPKSERFEMRVDEEILQRVDEWRGEQSGIPSRAEAMRNLVEIGLESQARPRETVHFTDGEKMIAMMLCSLFRHIKIPASQSNYEFIEDVITNGHTWAPKLEMQGTFHDHEDNPKNMHFVRNVLDMWSFIEDAFKKLPKAEKLRVEKEGGPVHFLGFDGNNETEHMGIAMFLIRTMGRFPSFRDRDLNSHMPTLARYSRMLRAFDPLRPTLIGKGLSADQLISILTAGRH